MDELVERLSRLALFADLSNPELVGVAHAFEEELFPEGARILRQGLSGSSLYFILDGEAAIEIDGVERARLGRGEFFGEVSVLLGEPPTARRRRADAAPLPRRPRARGAEPSCQPTRTSCTACSRPRPGGSDHAPVAGLEARPFPPGDYPVVVVGCGPGGLQTSYCLSRLGVEHAVDLRRRRSRAGCSAAGRSSSGCSRGRSRTRRSRATTRAVRVVRPQLAPRRRAGAPRPRGAEHGPHLDGAVASRDGARPRGVRR